MGQSAAVSCASPGVDSRVVPAARGGVMSELLLDREGRRRSPATLPGFHAGHAPGNKGVRYPADPPKVEEIVAVMHAAGDGAHGRRLCGLMVVMWRAGLRIQEALALTEGDLDQRRGSLLARRGKGRAPSRGRHGHMGMGTARALARAAAELPVGAAVRHQRRHARTPLVARRGARRDAAHRRRSRSAAPLCATPAPSRPRRRDGAGRRPADRHPAPTRTRCVNRNRKVQSF